MNNQTKNLYCYCLDLCAQWIILNVEPETVSLLFIRHVFCVSASSNRYKCEPYTSSKHASYPLGWLAGHNQWWNSSCSVNLRFILPQRISSGVERENKGGPYLVTERWRSFRPSCRSGMVEDVLHSLSFLDPDPVPSPRVNCPRVWPEPRSARMVAQLASRPPWERNT